VVVLSEGFESTELRMRMDCGGACVAPWTRVTTDLHTGSFAAYVPDNDAVSDVRLTSANTVAIPADSTMARLTFFHRFGLEFDGTFAFDGGVLEVSTDDGREWTDAGANILSGGYNGSIFLNTAGGNPLGGRAAWVNTSNGFQQVVVDLNPYRGQNLEFRLRLGTDVSNPAVFEGWTVDEILVTYQAPLSSCARTWSSAASYPLEARSSAVVGLNDAVYVFGGVSGGSPTTAAFRYSVENDSWSPIAALPEARTGARAVTDGTSIYVLGGAAVGGGLGTTTLWRYDPGANNYVTLASLFIGTAYHAAVYMDGAIYRIAGLTNLADADDVTSTVEMYDVALNSWFAAADYPAALEAVEAIALDGYIYAGGGEDDGDDTRKTYRYDPVAEFWDDGPIADLPPEGVPVKGHLYNGNWILLIEGAPYAWEPLTNDWRSVDQIPRLAFGGGAAVAGGAFHILSNSPVSVLQRYVETGCGGTPTPTATLAPGTPTPTSPPGSACLGDCGNDRIVSVPDLVRGVAIALTQQPLACPAVDGNNDGRVTVDELVAAVRNALRGCP
jgi:hypothetical protein